eukprot:jgi/Chrzof1/5648/Cz16g10050.t1
MSMATDSMQSMGMYNVTDAGAGGPNSTVGLSISQHAYPEYGPDFDTLSAVVEYQTPYRLHVKVQPSNQARWEVPTSLVNRPNDLLSNVGDALYTVQQPSRGADFAIVVQRKGGNNETVFNSSGFGLSFKDQYIEVSTAVPADADLYGLGEVTLNEGFLLPRGGKIITMWNRDIGSDNVNVNLYGSHPFYMQVNDDGMSHGVFMLNSNGMDVILNDTSVTYKMIGGLIDLYILLGPTPEAVIRQYHEVIGKPAMPPYWSLGYHQCRWGYTNLSVVEEVVANYSAADLPLEVMWTDIDWMEGRFWVFTFSQSRFHPVLMNQWVQRLSARGQHWVPIIDPAIAAVPGVSAYDEGLEDSVFIRNVQGDLYLGQVWPGPSHWPDFLNPNTSSWWQVQSQNMYDQAAYSGMWIDMNEPASFCTGSICTLPVHNDTQLFLATFFPENDNLTEFFWPMVTCQLNCTMGTDNYSQPPYTIHNFFDGQYNASLDSKTVAANAVHYNGVPEYNAHNIYGLSMAKVTYDTLISVTGKRPFVLSRATFPGSGQYAGHWTGDNAANWANLFYSIAGIINSNMWGMPLVGADICGFNDIPFVGTPKNLSDAEYEQLCNRWISAGAFYPFARNHYGYYTRPHELYRWPSMVDSGRKALTLRYRLLTYMYSAFFMANQLGGTVARALFFSFPADEGARGAVTQWMIGEAVLVTPVMSYNATNVTGYFPQGTWYSLWDYTPVNHSTGSANATLPAPLGMIPVHMRDGTIVPMQRYANVTRDVIISPITLVVALRDREAMNGTGLMPYGDQQNCADVMSANAGSLVSCGYLYLDDGQNITVGGPDSSQVWYTAVADMSTRSGRVNSNAVSAGASPVYIEAVHVLGIQGNSTSGNATVTVGGQSATSSYNATSGVLMVTGIRSNLANDVNLQWSM